MKKFLSVILVFLFSIIFSQNVGDFQSKVVGTAASPTAWTTVTNWTKWDGTQWVAQDGTAGKNDYPGKTSGTYNVTVVSGAYLSLPASPASFSFGDLIIKGNVYMSSPFTFATTNNLIIDGGTYTWNAAANVQNTLTLSQANASVIIKNSGSLVGTNCTVKETLVINSYAYAACNSGGTSYTTFSNLNTNGGTIAALPVANPTTLTPGGSVTLSASSSGYAPGTQTFTWTGTGPGGYIFNYSYSSNATPIVFPPDQSFVLNMLGTYTYTLKVTNGTVTDSQTVTVVVTGCPELPFEMANNFVATFHAGASKDAASGNWYAWGEDNGGTSVTSPPPPLSAPEIHLVSDTYYTKLPAGGVVKFVSGGSNGQDTNQLVALVGKATNTAEANRIYSIMDIANTNIQMVITTQSISLPMDGTYQIVADDVTSFYAGYGMIAIVARGKGFIYNRSLNKTVFGDGTAAGSNFTGAWGSSVKSSAVGNPEITNFVSIRGASSSSDQGVLIGLTNDGKIYTWGHNTYNGSATAANYTTANLVTLPSTAAGAKAVQVGANYATKASLYALFDNGEFWSLGYALDARLGNFINYGAANNVAPNSTATEETTWVRVRRTSTTFADVKYFTTQEHDGQKSSNAASVQMILSDKSLYGFGRDGESILGAGVATTERTNSTWTHPTYLRFGSGNTGTFDGSNDARTALAVEMGGHISFLYKKGSPNGSLCIAGHGRNGSLLGTNDNDFHDYFNTCSTATFTPCPITKQSSSCYKDAATGTGLPTTHGITALGRAGKSATATQGNASATQPDNWPMVRTGAWTALEAKTKGFVLNRIPSATANTGTAPSYTIFLGEPVNAAGDAAVISNPIKGMMFYDTTKNCLKINSDGTRAGWKCYTTQGCPTVN